MTPPRLPRFAHLLVAALLLAPAPAAAQRVLFDARHGQTAGAADWVVDADSSEQVWLNFRCTAPSRHHSGQRFPTPPQSEIGPQTSETFWDGGISAWAVALAKDALTPGRGRSWRIEQYAWDAPEFTFGDPTNPQDLSGYDVLVLCEPNVLFTDAEAQAVREFVASGGGLFLCADHETSDRNCSGGTAEVHDSPFILNRLMRTDVETRRDPEPYFDPLDPENDYGVFGIWFYENDNDDADDPDNHAFDWFTEATNRNVADDPADPILHGPFGDGTGGLGLFGSTQMAVSTDPERGNPTARAHVFRNGRGRAANERGVFEGVTFASAELGAGRVVAVGDSSPADDGTGEGALHPGWDRAFGEVANHVLFLNATDWLAGGGGAPPPLPPPPVEPQPQPQPVPQPQPAPAPEPGTPAAVDLSGWRLTTEDPRFTFTFPPGTSLPAGGYLVLGRDHDQAGFESEWGMLDPGVVYLDADDSFVVNATPRTYRLLDDRGEVVDGPTVPITRGLSRARRNGCLDPRTPGAWLERGQSAADPGRGAPPPCGAGVVITEVSDAGDFRNELVEIHFDAGAGEVEP